MQVHSPIAQKLSTTIGSIAQRLTLLEKKVLNLQSVGGSTQLSGQSLLLTGTGTPATPSTGECVIYNNGNGTPASVSDSGFQGQLTASQGNINQFTANSGSQTNVTAAWPIAAGDAAVGTVYRIKVYGFGTLVNSSNFSCQILVFGAAQTTGGVNTTSSGNGSCYWTMEATVAIVTSGASGTALMNLSGQVQNTSRGAGYPVSQGTTSTVSVNTTNSTTFQIQIACATGFSMTGYYSSFERLGS